MILKEKDDKYNLIMENKLMLEEKIKFILDKDHEHFM